MINDVSLENILFLDIETVPAYGSYDELSPVMKKLWDKKAERIKRTEEDTPDNLYPRAGIYAEFGRIICISAGFFNQDIFRLKSYYGDDEKELLLSFAGLLNTHFYTDEKRLCAHNGKEFDFPYIARRMLVNDIRIPRILDLHGKKPWEVQHLDTMELWKFGDHKNYTSLELLTSIFNIPTPKDDIDGSEVWKVYWKEKDLDRIAAYCQKDVVAIAQVFLRYQGMPILPEEKIILV